MENTSTQTSIICECGHSIASHEDYAGSKSQPGKCLSYYRDANWNKVYCKCEKFNGNKE